MNLTIMYMPVGQIRAVSELETGSISMLNNVYSFKMLMLVYIF